MRDKINDEVLCVLKYKENSQEVVLDYLPIDSIFNKEVEEFCEICQNDLSSLDDIISFFKNTEKLIQLNGLYKYCIDLEGSYQGFTVNFEETIKKILETKEIISFNKKNDPINYNPDALIRKIKMDQLKEFKLWVKGFEINKSYKKCYDNDQILTFSHRINGWSNPVYKLNPNFSIELKTNFGYGSASYFYTKLKYKDIEITPFSEWVDYEFARFSEIIRYTQSYLLRNEEWLFALVYAKEACNLSNQDEEEFIAKYIISECERMAGGLESLLKKEDFEFKRRGSGDYKVDKKGHILVEFRGEKISGALEFISKISEYKKIAKIHSFIDRIENCNKQIQIILANELPKMENELSQLNEEMSIVRPEYQRLQQENLNYSQKREELKLQMIANGYLNEKDDYFSSISKLNEKFIKDYPEFEEFNNEFKSMTEKYSVLNQKINNLINVINNIKKYQNKITEYFKNNN